jgi:hypothetical protein
MLANDLMVCRSSYILPTPPCAFMHPTHAGGRPLLDAAFRDRDVGAWRIVRCQASSAKGYDF